MFYLGFANEKREKRIGKAPDLETAIAIGEAKQSKYKAKGKHGMIFVYEIVVKCGAYMRKIYEAWEV